LRAVSKSLSRARILPGHGLEAVTPLIGAKALPPALILSLAQNLIKEGLTK